MYFLLKMVIFQPAILVYQRVRGFLLGHFLLFLQEKPSTFRDTIFFGKNRYPTLLEKVEQGLVSGSWSWRVLGTATGASFEASFWFRFASKSSREGCGRFASFIS